jgi:hypothetical protein
MTRLATAFVSKSAAMALRTYVVAASFVLAGVAFAQDEPKAAPPTAYKVRRALTVSGAPIDDAVIVVEGGKIVKIGKAADVEIPEKADVVDLGSAWAAPGFIHVASLAFTNQQGFDAQGRRDGGDRFFADEITPNWEQVERIARQGFTLLNVVPSDGGVSGHGCLVRPIPRRPGNLAAESIVVSRASCLMMGFAPRTSVKGFWKDLFAKLAPKPAAESKGATSSRSAESRTATDSKPAAESRPTAENKDPKMTPLLDVTARKLPGLLYLGGAAAFAHFEPFFKEHAAFRPTLVLPPDAWNIKERVAPLGVAVVLSTAASARPDTNVVRFAPLEYADLGLPVALIPETSAVSGYVDFVFHLTETARRGLDAAAVLRAVTLTPAEILGVADRTGSLDEGKSADILFFTGDPLAPSSRLMRTMAAGETVYDEAKEPR